MDNIENIVPEEGAENVEVKTTEENVEEVKEGVNEQQENMPEKIYTEEEMNQRVDEILKKRLARKEAKIRKEYDSKYGELENIIRAGTGKNDVSDVTSDLKKFYESRGVKIPDKPAYSERDIKVLAQAEANDIISSGFEDVIEEVDRLADIGVANMDPREKEVFKILAEHRKNAERNKELSKIGVPEDVYGSKEFKEFAGQFNSNTSIVDIYNIYNKMQPKKEVQTMGSVRNSASNDTAVKDFYTRDEALKFTKKDFDNNADLYKAVQRSMLKW